MKTNQTILLTGCAGFIGSRTSEMLLEQGHRVIGVDNLNNYYDPRVKQYRLKNLIDHKSFQFIEMDIENEESLNSVFADHTLDAVINLAARAGVRASIEDPHLYMRTNTVATLNLLECMVKYDVSKFVIASTSSLYAGQTMPFNEDSIVTRPISPYAATKLAAEALCHVWHNLYQIDVTILRYFTVYGPAGRPDMAPFRFSEWIRRGEPISLYGDGKQTRDFTYIDDIASGTIAGLVRTGYEIMNIGGGNKPISINRMIEILEETIGKRASVNYLPAFNADMKDTAADVSKAKSLLKWAPQIGPEQGLRQTAEWHLQNATWLNDVSL